MQLFVIAASKNRKLFIEAAAKVYAKELKLSRSKYTITINSVPRLLKESNIKGGCIKFNTNEIIIALDSKLDTETLTTVLAHEMVHAKQYAFGQLKVNNENFVWLGKKYKLNYYDSPWEVEAFSRERNLANKIAKLILVN